MQHKPTLFLHTQPNDDLFYLEYSMVASKNGEEGYCLHMSFSTIEAAERIFRIMKGPWMLPVEIEDNRVIVLPAKDSQSSGVFQCVSYAHGPDLDRIVGIRFKCHEYASEFATFAKTTIDIKNAWVKIPEMNRRLSGKDFDSYIYFNKKDLINTDHLIDKRAMQMNLIIEMMWVIRTAFFQITGRMGNDAAFYCMRVLVLHEAGNPNSYFNRFIELDKQFALHKQLLPVPKIPEKIHVSIKCSTLEDTPDNKFSMYFTCATPDQANDLYKIVNLCQFKVEKIFCHIIKISHGTWSHKGFSPGVCFNTYDPENISIEFDSEMDKLRFLELIKITNESIDVQDGANKIAFVKKSLPEFSPSNTNFNYDYHAITSTNETGTRVVIKDVNDHFKNWFSELPLQTVVLSLSDSLQIFKVNDDTVSIGTGKGVPGIRIQLNDGVFSVCNNMIADTILRTPETRKEHVQEKLELLDHIIESSKFKPIQDYEIPHRKKQNCIIC